jgi:hypothetical protein
MSYLWVLSSPYVSCLHCNSPQKEDTAKELPYSKSSLFSPTPHDACSFYFTDEARLLLLLYFHGRRLNRSEPCFWFPTHRPSIDRLGTFSDGDYDSTSGDTYNYQNSYFSASVNTRTLQTILAVASSVSSLLHYSGESSEIYGGELNSHIHFRPSITLGIMIFSIILYEECCVAKKGSKGGFFGVFPSIHKLSSKVSMKRKMRKKNNTSFDTLDPSNDKDEEDMNAAIKEYSIYLCRFVMQYYEDVLMLSNRGGSSSKNIEPTESVLNDAAEDRKYDPNSIFDTILSLRNGGGNAATIRKDVSQYLSNSCSLPQIPELSSPSQSLYFDSRSFSPLISPSNRDIPLHSLNHPKKMDKIIGNEKYRNLKIEVNEENDDDRYPFTFCDNEIINFDSKMFKRCMDNSEEGISEEIIRDNNFAENMEYQVPTKRERKKIESFLGEDDTNTTSTPVKFKRYVIDDENHYGVRKPSPSAQIPEAVFDSIASPFVILPEFASALPNQVNLEADKLKMTSKQNQSLFFSHPELEL